MKVAIAGYGVEGKSAEKYWHDLGHEVLIFDDGDNEYPNIAEISDVDLISRSPPIRPELLAEGTEVTSVTNEFMAQCPCPVIGVTGTKGKGTTSTLIARLLEADGKTVHLLGNIGEPALNALPSISENDFVVYEMSSFQLWDIKKSPHIAVVLMIEPDHMDVHKDMPDYVDAKKGITKHQTENDTVYYHPTNELSKQVADQSGGSKIPFMSENGAMVDNDAIYLDGEELMPVESVGLVGAHNLENICAAVSAVSQLVEDRNALRSVIEDFKGLPHRLQQVAEIDQVRFIDDSISTNPSTAVAAIKAFKEPKILILGGSDKGLEYEKLITEVPNNNVKAVITLGQTGQKIRQMLEDAGYSNVHQAQDMNDVITKAKELAESGDIVLLSPASASFDMFKGYKDRGEQFKAAVEQA